MWNFLPIKLAHTFTSFGNNCISVQMYSRPIYNLIGVYGNSTSTTLKQWENGIDGRLYGTTELYKLIMSTMSLESVDLSLRDSMSYRLRVHLICIIIGTFITRLYWTKKKEVGVQKWIMNNCYNNNALKTAVSLQIFVRVILRNLNNYDFRLTNLEF